MILFPLRNQKSDRHKQRQEFRDHDRQPHTGDADQSRQDQHDNDLEHKGPKE